MFAGWNFVLVVLRSTLTILVSQVGCSGVRGNFCERRRGLHGVMREIRQRGLS